MVSIDCNCALKAQETIQKLLQTGNYLQTKYHDFIFRRVVCEIINMSYCVAANQPGFFGQNDELQLLPTNSQNSIRNALTKRFYVTSKTLCF